MRSSPDWADRHDRPTGGEYRLQFRIGNALADDFQQRPPDPALDLLVLPPHQAARHELRHRMRSEHGFQRLARRLHAVEVAVDPRRFAREPGLQCLHEPLDRVLEVDRHAGKVHAVVHRPHRRHRNAVRRQHVEDLFCRAGAAVGLPGTADVVHANVEAIAVALERLRQSAQLRMPLEHQHALAFPRERSGGREAANAGPDDDDVPAA